MIKNILFDFDGVILDSMPVRDKGFSIILSHYPQEKVDALLQYHRNNGGLSRYNKLNHFFSNILQQEVNEKEVVALAQKFSEVMRAELTKKELLIKETVHFIEMQAGIKNLHIVSGSDGEELRYLCGQLEISNHFISIQGSPTPKTELVRQLMEQYGYDKNETILIGDSMNDYDAAVANGISFAGYNNTKLEHLGNYISTMTKADL